MPEKSLKAAVEMIRPGSHILLPPGSAVARSFIEQLMNDSERLTGSSLWSGLMLGDYPFAVKPHSDRLRYGTWHVMRPVQAAVWEGKVDYYPLRGSQVIDFIRRRRVADVEVLHLSPPDSRGVCSFGVSASYPFPISRTAPVLIGQINRRMPATQGPCQIALDQLAAWFEVDDELAAYHPGQPDEVSRTISANIGPLIPDSCTLQTGIGSIPEAVLLALRESGRSNLTLWGMGIDAMVDLHEAGMLREDGSPAVYAAELMGTPRLFSWADKNPLCQVIDFDACLDPALMARHSPFVSINSAVEVDLWGNANSEVLAGRQIGGVGGSLDFLDGARRSPGGCSIVALPATTRDGAVSRIVPRLNGVPQTVSRNIVQHVVTEYGCVDLSLMDLDRRAEAMVTLAAPQFRDELEREYRRLRRTSSLD